MQVPKLIWWRFKLEHEQALKVGILLGPERGRHEFYSRMRNDGRITVPKVTLKFLQDEDTSLEGQVLDVNLT